MLLSVMQVRVLSFGVLKDWLGSQAIPMELPELATVAMLLDQVAGLRSAPMLKGIAVSVNAEYATPGHILKDGDEVGLLPPVSGGSMNEARPMQTSAVLVRARIDADAIVSAMKRGEDGAVVVFDGVVRNNTRGRQTLYLDYEAYEDMALKQMEDLVVMAREKFGVREAKIIHRLGRLQIGETSVLIVVASAHRAQAYEASRWLIDTLKQTVPIWKKETFVDGSIWADGEPFPAALAIASEGTDGR